MKKILLGLIGLLACSTLWASPVETNLQSTKVIEGLKGQISIAGRFLHTTYEDQTYTGGTPVLGTGNIYVVGKVAYFIDSDGTATSMIGAGGGDPDQNLWETIAADTGSIAANTITDTFTITGGTNVTTTISGDSVVIDASGGGSGAFSDAGDPVVLNTTTKNVEIGDTGVVLDAKVQIGGDADEPQLVVEAHSTQTDDMVIFQKDDETQIFTVSGLGAVVAAGAISGSNLSGSNTGDNTVATSGDSATSFFPGGTLEVAIGGTGTTTSTGTVNTVLSNSPTLVTPVLGVATATTVNKVTLTSPATAATITATDGTTTTLSGGTHSGTNTGDNTTATDGDSATAFFPGGVLEVGIGGTGQTTYTNGQLLIGNTTGNTLAKATLAAGSSKQTITNGTGTITLDVAEGNIDHTAISNIGTNAHSVIDTHIAGTGTAVHGDSYLLNNGDVGTGTFDLGGATQLEIPNSGTYSPGVVDGQIGLDITITSHKGMLRYYDGTTEMIIPAIPNADLTSTDGHVIDYNSAGTKFTMDAPAAGGETNTLETNIPPNILINEIFIGTGSGTGAWAAVTSAGGDGAISSTGVLTVDDDEHAHTVSSLTVNTADIADVSVDQGEFSQLQAIGATTISANQWTALGGISETLTFSELDRLDPIDAALADLDDSPAWTGDHSFKDVIVDGTLDIGTVETFSDLDQSPDVSSGAYWNTFTNTLTILDFDGAGIADGQIITVFSKAAITFDAAGGLLRAGSADIVTASGDMTTWMYDGTDWVLIAFMDDSTDMGTDGGGAEVNNLETTDPPNVLINEIYIGTGTGTGAWAAVTSAGGDGAISSTGVLTVDDDEHAHIYSNIDQTTSANWINQVSDPQGTGAWVFATSPTLVTPVLGVASSTSLATTAATPLLLTNGQLVNIALTSQTVGATTLTIPDFASVVDEFTFKTKAQTMSNKTFVAPVLGTPGSGNLSNCTAYPEADTTVDTADEIIAIVNNASTTQIEHEAGGLEANVSAYGAGLYGQTAGFATIDIDTEAELETAAVAGANIILASEIDGVGELLAITDYETGTGALVFGTNPVLTTPTLGVATATTINKVTLTAPATAATITATDSTTTTLSGGTHSGTNTGDEPAASTTVVGVLEIAIASEVTTGSSAILAVSPDSLRGSEYGLHFLTIISVGSATAVTVANGTAGVPIPAQYNGWEIIDVHSNVYTKGVTGQTDVQIRRQRGATDTDVLTNKVTISNEYFASDELVNTANDDLATGDMLFADVDAIHSGTAPNGMSTVITIQKP